MGTRTFTTEEWEEIRYDNGLMISIEIVGQRRWFTETEYVFEFDGKIWRVLHDEPSTEMQEPSDDPIVGVEVEPYEKTITAYRPKE